MTNFFIFYVFGFLLLQVSSASEEPVLFEPIGTMATSLSYLHTMITLNLSSIDEQVYAFKKLLMQSFGHSNLTVVVTPYNNKPIMLERIIRELTVLFVREIEDLEQELDALKLALPPVPHHEDLPPGFNYGHTKRDKMSIPELDHGSPVIGNVTQALIDSDVFNLTPPPKKTKSDEGKYPYAKHYRSRVKRVLPLLALLTLIPGVLGTTLGLYNAAQISHVWSEITTNSKRIDSLIRVAHEHQNFLKYLETSIVDLANVVEKSIIFGFTLNRITNQIKNRIYKSIHAVQQANHRRFAVDFLSPHESHLLYAKLQARAETYNCILGIDKHSDLFQLELSYFYNGHTVSLILHVPIFPKDSFLRLFKLHPFPLPLTDTHLVFPDTKNDILGVSNQDSAYSAQFTSTDLMACHSINRQFFCDRNGVLQSNTGGGSCLTSLYQQDFVGAKVFCRFYIEPLQEYVYQLLENWFLIYSPKPQTAPIVCQNGTRRELHLSQKSSKFHLSSGCTIQLKRQKVSADLSVKLPSDFVMVRWNWEPLEIVNSTAHELSESLAKLISTGIARPQLSDLQMLVSNSRSGTSWFVHNFPIVIDIITLIILFSILFFLGYRIYMWKKGPATPPMEISEPQDVTHAHFEMEPLRRQESLRHHYSQPTPHPAPAPPAYQASS